MMKAAIGLFLLVSSVGAQAPSPMQSREPAAPSPAQVREPGNQRAPIYRITVVSRTTKAINYHNRTGTTRIDFRGTELMPAARGEAKVESQAGSTKIESKLEQLSPPSQFGPEFLTFVLWAITPEGRAENLGEFVSDKGEAKLLATTSLQSFGLIVTAEPYFAVSQPSDVVVAENFVRQDTTNATIQQIDVKYQLVQRGQYVMDRGRYRAVAIDPNGPLQLAEAENAVEIARLAGADRYASEILQKAETNLVNARGFLRSKNEKASITNAREAAQTAEDARLVTLRKIEEEQLAAERSAAAEREAEARQQAEESAQRAQLEEQRRAQADAERRQAEQAKSEAQQAAQQAAAERAAAEAARQAALEQQKTAQAEADRARQTAQLAEQQRQQAEADKTALRERIRQQLNSVLETRETQRGLIVNISDVQFDFNKYTLKPTAREKIAKLSGILLAYPGLSIKLEGHTDNVGSPEYNLTLSEERANAVRSYLIAQGVPATAVSAQGMGEDSPVASNNTAEGRQQNRRVDMVVAGEPIGVEPGTDAGAAPAIPPQVR